MSRINPVDRNTTHEGIRRSFDSVEKQLGVVPSMMRTMAASPAVLKKYARTRELVLAPAYADGDERAGMHFHLDYYARPDRGAVPAWRNEMAEMTWFYWFTFNGLAAAAHVTTPTLFVHSDDCVFPDNVKQVYASVQGPKKIVWTSGAQIDFYDQREQVEQALSAIGRWFERTLAGRPVTV